MKLGRLVEDSNRFTGKSLKTRDEPLAEQVRATDKVIEALEP